MKKISFIIVLSLLVLSLASSHLLATTRGISVTAKTGKSLYLYEDYYALVVGVSDYEKWPRLPNAVNDAKEVASKLEELGFEVKLVLDPTSREMKTVLSEMIYDIGKEENRALLIYYAGHGETETLADKTKMGHIIPRDCPILERDPKGFATHAISMRDIESASMRIKSKHVLMLFDSCFSGSLFALVRAVPDDITEKSTLPVRQYITAGREDEQVPDKSMFKRCFLIGLDGDADLTGDGYITASELGMYLSDKVVNYTHRRQHPQYGKINNPDLDRGDFIFALKAPLEPPPVAPEVPPPSLEAEKQRLAEERLRLERERLELEQLKAMEKREAKREPEEPAAEAPPSPQQVSEKPQVVSKASIAKEHKKSSWYIGFGFGTGDSNWQTNGEGVTSNDWDEVTGTSPKLTFNLGIGMILNPKLHLGLDMSGIIQSGDEEIDGYDIHKSVEIANYLIALTYFPKAEGFFIKAGAGASEMDYSESGGLESVSESYNGTAILGGLGYALWLGKTFNLCVNAEYSYQGYNGEEAPNNSHFWNVYLSCYWF